MAKVKTVNQNSLVLEIMTVGGVNKENATGIFNVFTNAWNTDRIGTLKAIDTGIVVKTKRTAPAKKKAPAKKAAKIKVAAPTKKSSKGTKKKTKTSTVIAEIKTKSKKKLKGKKTKKLKAIIPATKISKRTNATA